MNPLTAVLPTALAQLLKTGPLSAAKIECAWSAAVGPALQRVTAVHLQGTVLVVDAATVPWAREISRSAPLILSRLAAFLGPSVVTSIDVRYPRA
jgi:predicted nucleic acid-binding Zn ribbon protein